MSNAAKRGTLPEDLQAFAEERVRMDEYANVDDVTHEAFRLSQQRNEHEQQVREDLAALFGEMAHGNYLEPSDGWVEQSCLCGVQSTRQRHGHVDRAKEVTILLSTAPRRIARCASTTANAASCGVISECDFASYATRARPLEDPSHADRAACGCARDRGTLAIRDCSQQNPKSAAL